MCEGAHPPPAPARTHTRGAKTPGAHLARPHDGVGAVHGGAHILLQCRVAGHPLPRVELAREVAGKGICNECG